MHSMVAAEFPFMSELERYDEFMRLYNSIHFHDKAELVSLLNSKDSLVPLVVLQYLEDLPERKAVLPILRLVERGNEIISRAAMNAYRRNHFPGKAQLLKRLVLSNEPRACRFAVRTLSRAGFMDILPLLLRELPDREGAVRLEMIEALRFLPDRRSTRILVELAALPDEAIRSRAVSVLADLQTRTKTLDAGFFVQLTKDDSEKVRRSAMEALKSFSSRKVAGLILAQALDPAEPEAPRDRAIRAMAAFPSRDVATALTRMCASDESPPLRLACEVTLRGFPARALRDGLVPLTADPSPDVRRQAAMFLADFLSDDPSVRKAIFGLWDKADDAAAIDLVEALRLMQGPDAAARLRDAVRRAPLVAYSAAGALARMSGAGAGFALLSLIRDEALPATVRQALFAYWSKRGPDENIKGELLPHLLHALPSTVINIRYLSLQILEWYPLQPKLRALLDVLCQESDPEVVNTISRQILHGLGRDPLPLVSGVVAHPERHALAGHLVRMLTAQSWDTSKVDTLRELLKAPPLSLLERNPETYTAVCVHLFAYGTVTFQDLWEELGSPERRRVLVRLLISSMNAMRRRFPHLPMGFLSDRLPEMPPEGRALCYELMAAEGSPASAEALTGALLAEEHPEALAQGAALLRGLMTGDHR